MNHHYTVLDILLVLARYALALAVTIHVLRTKRDTAASTGWIGIAWLMPLTGAALYVMFGVNRVRRLARKLIGSHQWDGRGALVQHREQVDGQFAPLARMLGRLTERPLLGGNVIQCLHDGDNTYPVMLAAIDNARQSVLLCSYIFRADEVGNRFIEALANAQARGVRVHVLVDGIGSGYFHSGVASALRRRNIACHRFMHSLWPWRMPFINLRNHRKILVVDGRVGFMGGLNIGEENMLRLRTKVPVADTHFRIEGPIVHQLTEAFARDWSFTCQEELDGEIYFPQLDSVGDIPMRIVTSGPDNDLEKIEFAMLQGVALARRSVRLMTPYFLPDERLTSELCLAALRGVEIDIIVPGSSNHRLIDYARDANLAPFLDAGCRIWMAQPPFNHAKLLVVDEDWSFVGSSNIDVRSLRLNFEINMEVYDKDLARELIAFIDRHRHGRLTHHTLDSQSGMVKLRNAGVRLFMPYL
ncbi:phospholipase D [Neoasaia chiangmaiensis NBRC 101099]|uniref:Cardiolipin synthase n=1 Tax=Neoasaia chiangmaiensis TaxID=320497 RepID=A0A1U9KMU0_9PROT|nr:cardiolipin synthase [Neoasaia chiangmaiensis]AQS87099.1 cardiolipin synthase [Neoasaia chiangmaiensis]GBR38065.1 phospholipase D [Neoasaia chiangmaiensis NBRC 101099]GEN16069.1 cardiolipin synthetase [Neoasaia chiangmaiensis]